MAPTATTTLLAPCRTPGCDYEGEPGESLFIPWAAPDDAEDQRRCRTCCGRIVVAGSRYLACTRCKPGRPISTLPDQNYCKDHYELDCGFEVQVEHDVVPLDEPAIIALFSMTRAELDAEAARAEDEQRAWWCSGCGGVFIAEDDDVRPVCNECQDRQ